MGIRIVWDNAEKTIIRHIYEGLWTLEDYYKLIEENHQQIASVNHRVDIINDLRQMAAVPPNITSAIKYATRKAHANEGINVIVGSPAYVKLLIEAVNKLMSAATEVVYTDNLEDAYKIIANRRADS